MQLVAKRACWLLDPYLGFLPCHEARKEGCLFDGK